MKSLFAVLLITMHCIVLSLPVVAQDLSTLKDVNDATLPQLIKQKKNIHFAAVPGKHGTVIKWYEVVKQPVTSPAVMSAIAGAATDNFHLVKDINIQTDANPVNSDFIFNAPYAVVNGGMYFSANDGIHGAELWRSNGTAAGTYMVKDLLPGATPSNPTEIIAAGNSIYFVTQNISLSSYQLWTSDGTESGTTMLQDLQRQGPGVNTSYELTYTGNAVFYMKYDPFSNNTQLWKTTGTADSTVLVKDFGNSAYAPLEYKAAKGLFYFTIYSFTEGRELWRSDGTDAGTFMVKDITPNDNFFNGPEQLTAFNNKLYFSADDGSGRKLWLTDGSTAGTIPAPGNEDVTITDDGSFPFTNESFAVQGNSLYMLAATSATGSELYKYNISNGFSLVKDITPGAAGGYIHNITPAYRKVAFQYDDTLNKKTKLWGTDGATRTVLIKSFDEGYSGFDQLTPGNRSLYFVARDSSAGYELWKTDGTTKGTVMVKDIYTGATSSRPADLTFVNGSLYFTAASQKAGTELWRSMGEAANTVMVTEINKTATASSGPGLFLLSADPTGNTPGSSINNTYYFSAFRPETGYELYKTEVTGSGASLAKDIVPGEISSFPTMFSTKRNAVYFVATTRNDSGVYVNSLFRINSTGNISRIADFPFGFVYSYDVADNGWVYYTIRDFLSNAFELWRTDGTLAGNIMLTNKLVSSNYSFAVKTIGNTAYFTAADEDGAELWKTNGSIASIKKVKDINKGSNSSNPYSLYVFKNNLYFGADDGTGTALWRSNGTAKGTVKLQAIQPAGVYDGSHYSDYFCVINDVLYMNASTATTGYELWKTDGTGRGTMLVKDISDGSGDSNPSYLTNVNGTLFFSTLYNGLWKSDGSATGTVPVNTFSGSYYELFTERCVADGKLFFNTDKLLWVSDGTDNGTHLVSDNGLNGVSKVTNLATTGCMILFNGYTDKYGYELYAGDATKVATSALLTTHQQLNRKPSSFTSTVLQNPVAGMLKMNVVSDKDQTINIVVSNAIGNIAAQQKVVLYKGSNNVQLSAAGWQQGIYLIKLYNTAGDGVSVQVLK